VADGRFADEGLNKSLRTQLLYQGRRPRIVGLVVDALSCGPIQTFAKKTPVVGILEAFQNVYGS
jgi:hypothetical protein